MPVKEGDYVKIQYTGTLDDGTVFDSTDEKGEPLVFKVGGGDVLPAFEEAIIGMDPDEEQSVTIPPKKAYGEHNDELVQTFSKDALGLDQAPQVGRMLTMSAPNGAEVPGKIVEVENEDVTIDFNHLLAGENLHFDVKVLKIIK